MTFLLLNSAESLIAAFTGNSHIDEHARPPDLAVSACVLPLAEPCINA
jgi:hypothetical protein